MPRPSAVERFLSKVDRNGPVAKHRPDLGRCHVWTAGRFSGPRGGYGMFWAGTTVHAHRWWWEQNRGPVPDGLVLDHFACDRRECVNLDHLQPTTNRENVLREDTGRGPGSKSRQEVCGAGHPLTEENVYRFGPGKRWRACRTCKRRTDRDAKRRKYAAQRPDGLAAQRLAGR